MRVLEIYLNGKRLCLAGVENDGVLTATTSWVARRGKADMWLNVGGLISATGEHVSWLDRRLRVGDQIKIKIGERGWADTPRIRYRRDSAKELKAKERYVREMAKQLGWEIRVPRLNRDTVEKRVVG